MQFNARTMRSLFYIGVMLVLIGMGVAFMNQRLAGAIVICIGAACIVLGLAGLKFYLLLKSETKRKQKGF